MTGTATAEPDQTQGTASQEPLLETTGCWFVPKLM